MGVLSISFRNLSRRKLRATIMILIIMVVCGAFVSIVSVRSGIRATDVGQEAAKELDYHIRLSDAKYVTDGSYDNPDSIDYAKVSSKVMSEIDRTWSDSVVFDPRLNSQDLLIRTNTSGRPHSYNNTGEEGLFYLVGVNPYMLKQFSESMEGSYLSNRNSRLGMGIVNGSYFSENQQDSLNPQREVIISQELADIENITVNDTIAIFYENDAADSYEEATDFEINLSYISSAADLNRTGYNVTVIGIFSGINFRYIYMDMESALEFLNRKTSTERFYTTIFIRIDDTDYLADASLYIKDIANSEELDYVNKLEATNAIQSYTDVTGIQVAFITLIVAFLVIFNSMQMSVHERIKELGTIRALGAETTTAIAITVFEGFILGVLGGFLGYFFSMSLALLSSNISFLAGALEFATVRGVWYLGASTLLGAGLASLAALIPALVTTMTPPEITLKQK